MKTPYYSIPVTSEIELFWRLSRYHTKMWEPHPQDMQKGVPTGCSFTTDDKIATFQDLYRAFILPYFKYCAEAWHHCSKWCAAKLEKVNKRAIRFVCNADKSTQYGALLKQLGLSTLLPKTHQDSHTVYITLHNPDAPKNTPRFTETAQITLQS